MLAKPRLKMMVASKVYCVFAFSLMVTIEEITWRVSIFWR